MTEKEGNLGSGGHQTKGHDQWRQTRWCHWCHGTTCFLVSNSKYKKVSKSKSRSLEVAPVVTTYVRRRCLFSKMGDKGEGVVKKSQKKGVMPFMDGPLYLYTYTNLLIEYSKNL